MSDSQGLSALILAGGTGGHVYPALAVADALRALGWDVQWLGSKAGIENRLVPAAGIPLHAVRVGGLRGKGWGRRLMAPIMVGLALIESIRIIARVRPALVLGMGGFTSGPAGVAAWLLRRPLVIHEQNAVCGLTNRLLARIARRVLEAFPHSFRAKGVELGAKLRHTGNPVRTDIVSDEWAARFDGENGNRFSLLVLGGSQGAEALNRVMPEVLGALRTRCPDTVIELVHQAGPRNIEAATTRYAGVAGATVVAYIEDMSDAYSRADLVVCRAGAMTVAELAAAAVPSLLVPYPYAVDDHQTANAKYLSDAGAAYLVPESELTVQRVAESLAECIEDPARLQRMAQAARGQAMVDATLRVVHECTEVAHA